MKKAPNLVRLENLRQFDAQTQLTDGTWVPARPIGYHSIRHRIRLAWMVFTGKADALIWPGQ